LAFGIVGRFGGSSAGFVVAALNAASAASREVVVLRVLSSGILCPLELHFLKRHARVDSASRGLMMLPRLSAGFLFCCLGWRSTRQLSPRLPVVRVLVDPVEQLLAAWLFALDRWDVRLPDHLVLGRSDSSSN
jgi:hypothetical protein